MERLSTPIQEAAGQSTLTDKQRKNLCAWSTWITDVSGRMESDRKLVHNVKVSYWELKRLWKIDKKP